jgi:hypothetical protein
MDSKVLITRIFLLLASLVAGPQLLFSQTVSWAKEMGKSPTIAHTPKIIVCSDSSSYLAGTFDQAISIGKYTLKLPKNASTNIFLAHLDIKGNPLWLKRIGGYRDAELKDIKIDKSNHIYIAGDFYDTLKLDSAGKKSFILNNPNKNLNKAIFIARLDTSGSTLWANMATDTSQISVKAICADTNNNVIMGGVFRQTAVFGSQKIKQSVKGAYSFFYVKYTAKGKQSWVKTDGLNAGDSLSNMACDKRGNFYVTGIFHGNTSIGGRKMQSACTNTNTVCKGFIAKYNALGDTVWGRQVFFTCPVSLSTNLINSIGTDQYDNVYISGNFNGEVIVEGTSAKGFNADDIFISKLSPGGEVKWVQTIAGKGNDESYSMMVCKNGTSYISGYSPNNITLSSANKSSIFIDWNQFFKPASYKLFIARYDSAGNLGYVYANPSNAVSNSMTSNSNSIYLSGYLNGGSVLGPDTLNYTTGTNPVFYAKFATAPLTGNILSIGKVKNAFCGGDTFSLPFNILKKGYFPSSSTKFAVQLSDSSGSFFNPAALGTDSTPSGIIHAKIPLLPISGKHYRLRVTVDRSEIYSNDNGNDISLTGTTIIPSGMKALCPGDTIIATTDSALSYLWNNNKTSQAISIYSAGKVFVSKNNCPAYDTLNIFIDNPHINLGRDTFLMQGDTITLDGGKFYSYLWSNYNTSRFLQVSQADSVSITIMDSNGCIARDTIVIRYRTGIEKSLPGSEFTLFPNPSGDYIQIQGTLKSLNEQTEIQILSQDGKILKSVIYTPGSLHFTKTISLDDLSKGVYYCKLRIGGSEKVWKVVWVAK